MSSSPYCNGSHETISTPYCPDCGDECNPPQVSIKQENTNTARQSSLQGYSIPRDTRHFAIVIGPYMGLNHLYEWIGSSTYTFPSRQEYIEDWEIFIKERIFPNHIQWNDHNLGTELEAIKRCLFATRWTQNRGPCFLGVKESSASTVDEFLTRFPTIRSIIYVIVEFQYD